MDAAVASSLRAIDLAAEGPFRVGAAMVDPVSREATLADSLERLQPQHLKVLIALVRGQGRVVTRDELVECCWDGRFVGDDVINRAISTLRKFAERAGGFYIETVPRTGYRLVERSRRNRSPFWLIGAGVFLALLVAGIAFVEWHHDSGVRQMPTIAILPFTTASGDASERDVAIDARDSVAHKLSQSEYRVGLANNVATGSRADPDFVVSADVSGSSDKMVVAVRVEDTVHHAIVYSNRFESERARADELAEQIGAQVAGSLGWTASLLMLDHSYPSDPAITAELFRGPTDYQTARQIAGKAPNSVIAQMVLAFTTQDVLPDLPLDQRAEAAAIGRRALDRIRVLAPNFGGSELLWCLLRSHARMIECEDHLRAGIRRDPYLPGIGTFLASELKDVGRTNEALQIATTQPVNDPYVPARIGLQLRMLEALGRHDEAEDLYRESRRGWPDESVIFWDRVYGMLDRGNFDALARFRDEVQAPSELRALEPALPLIAALKRNDPARVRRLCPATQGPGFMADLCMLALGQIGDRDDAFTLAWRIYPNRIGRTPAEEDRLWLESGRYFDSDILMGAAARPLRSDPRYVELARRLGALAYWRSGRLPDFCRFGRPEALCQALVGSARTSFHDLPRS